MLSGGQAPGGHNVIAGLFDYLVAHHPASKLYGFLDGPRGLFTGTYVEVDAGFMAKYRNMGGFDMIGSGRDKIETPEQFAGCVKVCGELQLNGVVVIGGDDSNTNAALVAEHFAAKGLGTVVIGVGKTIDGDLRCVVNDEGGGIPGLAVPRASRLTPSPPHPHHTASPARSTCRLGLTPRAPSTLS